MRHEVSLSEERSLVSCRYCENTRERRCPFLSTSSQRSQPGCSHFSAHGGMRGHRSHRRGRQRRSPAPSVTSVRQHTGLRRLVVRRLDRSVATGLLLTLALALTLVGGLVLGVLALLVRRVASSNTSTTPSPPGYTTTAAPSSTSGLKAITELGNIKVVVGFAIVLVIVDAVPPPQPLVVSLPAHGPGRNGGEHARREGLVGRVRPTLNPAAATLGPSFPSGHSATAAAFYAAAALIIGRSLRRPARQLVIAGRRRDRGRRRRQPRTARPALALGRRRRPRARLGLVRPLRRRVRRTATHADRRRRRCGRGGRVENTTSSTPVTANPEREA